MGQRKSHIWTTKPFGHRAKHRRRRRLYTSIFDKNGLDLDSVDGLELAVGIEQKFGIKIGPLTEDVARNKFANAVSIRNYILEFQKAPQTT